MKYGLLCASVILCVILAAGCSPKPPPILRLIILFQEQNYDEAIKLAEKLIAENPDDSQAYRFLLRSALSKGEGEAYRTKYQELVKANPDVAGYHFALGFINTQFEDFEAAIPELEKAIELNPEIEFAHYMLGWIYIAPTNPAPDFERALAEWKKEEQLDPKSLGALQVYTIRADYYLRIGDAEGAEKDYERIAMYAFAPGDRDSARDFITKIRTLRDELARLEAEARNNPDDPNAHFQLGVAQYNNAKMEEAIASWTRALELDPENSELRNYLGKALLEQGRYEEAAPQFQKAIELDSNNPTIYYNLAVAEDFLGKTTLAIEHYKKYIELNPIAPKLEEVKKRLVTLEGGAGAGDEG